MASRPQAGDLGSSPGPMSTAVHDTKVVRSLFATDPARESRDRLNGSPHLFYHL